MVYDKWQRGTVPEREYFFRNTGNAKLRVQFSKSTLMWTWQVEIFKGGWRMAEGTANSKETATEMVEKALTALIDIRPTA